MRKSIQVIVFILFCPAFVYAQNNRLKGTIKYQSSGGKMADGVKVSAFEANAVYTVDGFFELVFSNKQAGEKVEIAIGSTDKYGNAIEVVNKEQLSAVLPTLKEVNSAIVEIIVAKVGENKEKAKRILKTIEKEDSRTNIIFKKLEEIQQQIKQPNVDEQTKLVLMQENEQLKKELAQALIKLNELAKFIASIDKDQAPTEINNAINKIAKKEDVGGAIKILEKEQLSTATTYKRRIPIWYRSRFYSSIGVGAGSAYFMGDIKPTVLFSLSNGSIFFARKLSSNLSGRVSLSWHRLGGDDFSQFKQSSPPNSERYIRNLHFRNDIFEAVISGILETGNSQPFFKRKKLAPYIMAGIGVIRSNPQAKTPSDIGSTPSWISLRPLRTEGIQYSPWNVVMPLGIGAKYKISQRLDLGIEFNYYFTSSDFLDDVKGTYISPNTNVHSLSTIMAYRGLEPTAANLKGNREEGLRYFAQSIYGVTDAESPKYNPFDGKGVFQYPKAGTSRASSRGNDSYLLLHFKISYILVQRLYRQSN